MAKTVQVSADGGSTRRTLPGGTADITREAGQITDTVFGQSFQSQQPGLIDWGVTGQAFYKGYSGYMAKLLRSGTTTAASAEAMSLVSGKTYKTTDAAKNLWDPDVAVVVYDNAVDHTADVVSINHLFGEVTFDSDYTVTGPVTVDMSYFPLSVLGRGQSYTLTMQAAEINKTTFAGAQANGGYMMRDPGLRTVGLDVEGIYSLPDDFESVLLGREVMIIEINPDGEGKSRARGFFKLVTDSQSGDVGALEQETLSFVLNVPDPDSGVELPFRWNHLATSTLSEAVRIVLDAWEAEQVIEVSYSEDGTNGHRGDAVVTECSMSGSLDGMNEFSVTFAGDGALTAFP